MQIWLLYICLYAIFLSIYYCSNKKAIEKNSVYEVLAFFSTIGFALVAFTCKDVFKVDRIYLFIIFIKSLVIMCSWTLSLKAMKKMSLSLYSVIRLSGIIFTILLSVLFLGEKITSLMAIGIIIVLTGLILVNTVSINYEEKRKTKIKSIVILLGSCLFSAISSIIDKKLLMHIKSGQLQFWFLFFMTIIYWVILLGRRKKINFKAAKKNFWIPLASISLIIGDRFLFMGTEIPESKMSIITIVKQMSAVYTIILGKYLFKEKDIAKKLLCSILIIGGIVLTVL